MTSYLINLADLDHVQKVTGNEQGVEVWNKGRLAHHAPYIRFAAESPFFFTRQHGSFNFADIANLRMTAASEVHFVKEIYIYELIC